VGLKSEHFQQIVDSWPDLGFFEIHAENYMIDGGPFHHYLTRIREQYPLSIHGVGLSIGGETALDIDHLQRLAALINRYQPQSYSEHLAWASHGEVFVNDLLPLAYTPQSLQRVCDHIDQVQAYLGRQMLLENPATYVEFRSSSMTETDFISAVLQRTGCGLLLDVNNVFVTCTNHNRDPYFYIQSLPHTAVGEIHLAGFTSQSDADGAPLLIDNHGSPIAKTVWDLYEYTLAQVGPVATLIERDNDIPSFDTLFAENQRAESMLQATIQNRPQREHQA
tara:strand:+ start:9188 stop:10024 length:837 start_codon:yes stop_codon:yes gene_type:complete